MGSNNVTISRLIGHKYLIQCNESESIDPKYGKNSSILLRCFFNTENIVSLIHNDTNWEPLPL